MPLWKSSRLINSQFFARQMSDLTKSLHKLGLNNVEHDYPGSNPELNPVDIYRSAITNELAAISGVSKDLIYPALESTIKADSGDLVIPIPRLRVKGTPAEELASEWAKKFPKSPLLEKVVPAGKFLQFYFNPSSLYELVVRDILKRGPQYGESSAVKGKNVIVEFSSPNIAKPFHAGHLRSTIIGGFISNLYEKHGANVTRINYLGDWGKQFGLLAVGFDRYGSEEKLKSNPIDHLFEIYVRINKEKEEEAAANPEGTSKTDDEARSHFRKMEDGDKDAIALWSKLRNLSIEKYRDTYSRLNIHYDEYSGESQVTLDEMFSVIKTLEEKDLTFEDRGALLVPLTKYSKKLGKCLVRKSDGTTLYITRDLGEAIKRQNKFKFDKMIYVAASQQDLHFQQFFKILEVMGLPWAKDLQHINFGMVQGMSTRKGTVVFLDKILEETKESMHEVMKKNEAKYAQIEDPEKVADLVGLSAVMIQDMQSKRINNYTFDWKRMLSFEGDTGPYLQYAHSRLCSMERNSNITKEELLTANFDLLTEPAAVVLVRLLAAYPDVLLTALKNLEPSTVITYLFRLTHAVSSCYDVLWVMNQEKEVAVTRLALYSAARQVLSNGLLLLGITPVERM